MNGGQEEHSQMGEMPILLVVMSVLCYTPVC